MAPLLLAVLLVLLSPAAALGGRVLECPGLCVCDTWRQLPRATCAGQRLYSIHTGVSSVVQDLDLSNNSISKLDDRELSRAGLTRLKYLNLSMNAINEIGPNAFDNLKNLSELDLSMNHIDYIERDTFYYNKNLRILHLAGNKFNLHVPKLHSLSIAELDFSGCRIDSLPEDTFLGLKQLRKLDLSNNNLMELDKMVLRNSPYLRTLIMNRNNWDCNGRMFDLKSYLRSKNVHTDAFCERPTLAAKFAKMVALKTVTAETDPKSMNKLPEPRNANSPWDVESWRELEEVVQQEQDQVAETAGPPGIFASGLSNVSPFWFVLIGFLLGSGATMVVTYLWLSTTISCLIPRIRRAEAADSADASSQRVSLLRHLWQQESMANSEESSSGNSTTGSSPAVGTACLASATAPSCPGTPPPPYREVMLHRNLYPRAAMAAAAAAQQQVPITYNI